MSVDLISRHVLLSAKPDSSAIRVAQFNSRSHLVVPVVAMVGDSVVWPSNGDGPEFVPIAALEYVNPINWNNRPCVAFVPNGHPDTSNGSANFPEVIETACFGYTFNAHVDDGKLKLDAYLDIDRAKEIGGGPESVISRLQAGEMVEISIGALVSTKEESGEHDGKLYKYVWQAVVSDHLAFLSAKEKGACSNKIGCGAPRLNSANIGASESDDNKEDEMPDIKPTGGEKVPWLRRLLAMFNPATYSADQSTNDLEQELSNALTEKVPLFGRVVEIRYEAKQVIYSAYETAESRWDGYPLYYLRDYSINNAGEVSLADNATQVEATMMWTPVVSTSEAVTEITTVSTSNDHECSCHKGEKGETMTKKELIAQLISNDKSPFVAADEATLNAFDEPKLKALADGFTSVTAAPAEVIQATVTPAETTVVATADLALLRALGERLQREDAARRLTLISSLRSAQSLHTEAALTTMDTPRLEEMYQLLGLARVNVYDYSGLGLPTAPSSSTEQRYKPVNNSFEVALARERGEKPKTDN